MAFDRTLCPTPGKQQFSTMKTARGHAFKRAIWSMKKPGGFATMYGYRCLCGYVHLTRREFWNGNRHVMLARLHPMREFMDKAYLAGVSDSMQFLKNG